MIFLKKRKFKFFSFFAKTFVNFSTFHLPFEMIEKSRRTKWLRMKRIRPPCAAKLLSVSMSLNIRIWNANSTTAAEPNQPTNHCDCSTEKVNFFSFQSILKTALAFFYSSFVISIVDIVRVKRWTFNFCQRNEENFVLLQYKRREKDSISIVN